MDLQDIGKLLAVLGAVIAVLGGLVWLAGRAGLTDVPGTLRFGGQDWGCVVPIGLSLLLSLLLTLVMSVLARYLGR